MQRLILMRHAEAELPVASGRDRDRRLSVFGRSEARAMGQALAARGLQPDHALVSPARRTRETWDLLGAAFGEVEARFDESLYNGSADALRQAVDSVAAQAACLLVLAHNPGVHRLAVDYLVEGTAAPAALDQLSLGYPTGAATVFTVSATGRCAFEAFLQPRDEGLA